MFNFDTPDNNATGLDVCLSCFQAFSRSDVNYTHQHLEATAHALYLNIVKTLKDKPKEKIAKLEIKESLESDNFDVFNTIYCVACDATFDIDSTPSPVQAIAKDVLASNSSARNDEIKAWEQEIVPCEHSVDLQQTANRPDLTRCAQCELGENLWLCLHCGALGCGRQQYGSALKGNGHALKHFEDLGHPVAVKLGSLSPDNPDSCDIYCYQCNDEVKVPEVAAKLQTFGIDINQAVKTEKSLIELNLDQNLNWEFNLDGANGERLPPVYGPDLTGFQNLGNSCYLNSVIQALYSLKALDYFRDKSFPKVADPATDLESQLIKLYHGLKSGKYSVPNPHSFKGDDYQLGIRPSTFKALIGENHAEFSSQRQQDAFEFLLYLLDKLDAKFGLALTRTLKFLTGTKVVCTKCNHGKINYELVDNIGVPVEDEVIGTNDGKKLYKEVKLSDCFAGYFEPSAIEDYQCDTCSEKTVAVQTPGLRSLPETLVVNAKRIKLENWVPVKIDVPIKLEDVIDVADYVGTTFGEDEIEVRGDPAPSGTQFVPDAEAFEMLLGMGFTDVRATKALFHTGNKSAEDAMNWVFAHMDDADIDDPFVPEPASTTDPSTEQIDNLVSMGFSAQLAKKALVVTGDVNAAVEWLFNNPNDDGVIEEAARVDIEGEKADLTKTLLEKELPSSHTKYRVKSVICHKGTSPHTGHYVAFVRKLVDGSEKWVLYNDEKVVVCDTEIEDIENNGYIYILERL